MQNGAVEEMRTERTKLLTASAGRGGNVDDGGNDIHNPSPDVNVVGLTSDDCDDKNAAATPGGCDRGTMTIEPVNEIEINGVKHLALILSLTQTTRTLKKGPHIH